MTTPMIGVFRARDGRQDELIALVRDNVRLLRSKNYLSDTPETLLRTADGVILAFEYGDGGAEAAHGDADVLELWGRFGELADSLGLNALPSGSGVLPGAVAVE